MVVLPGWSCYRDGRVGEVENLGVNFPPKKLCTVVSLACMHDWGDAWSLSLQEQLLLGKNYSDINIMNRVMYFAYYIYWPHLSDIQRQNWPWPRSADWRCNIKWSFSVWPLYFVVFAHEWLCMYEWKHIFSPCFAITPNIYICYHLAFKTTVR
jgi:hypothetical protein